MHRDEMREISSILRGAHELRSIFLGSHEDMDPAYVIKDAARTRM